ncbi:MAG: hypothetical protein NT080_07240 [Spirochaetes bacterium]|nr:hypothetical protein [Spirochaetota bacterium]
MSWFADIVNRVIDLGRLGVNIATQVTDYYLIKKLQDAVIHNDRGASFTDLKRSKGTIEKRAQGRGEAKLVDEMEWYLTYRNTPTGSHFPDIVEHSTEPGNVFYRMRYYNYPNLRTVIMSDMNAFFFLKLRWKKMLGLIREELFTESRSAPTAPDFVVKNHLRKLYERVDVMKRDAPFLVPVADAKILLVNGKRVLGWRAIADAVASRPDVIARLTPPRVYVSHGDVHCNNILCGISAGNFIMLDCRGRAPDGTLFFDPAYDVAKIFHDLRSQYSLIEKHFFSVFLGEEGGVPCIEFEFTQGAYRERFMRNYEYVRPLIAETFTGYGELLYRADFTEAMLYLTMVPFHLRFRGEGLVCFTTGLLRLNEWLETHHPDIRDAILEAT